MERMTYAGSGVDYGALDPFKRRAQLAGRSTADVIRRLGVSEVEMSRGESAYLVETPESYLAHVEEGLGTKNLVADAMYRLVPGRSYYDHIAQDTVAMIVNDMVTLGALPLAVAMHLGVGSSDWFKDERRASDLVEGWKKACQLARCAWGGGETPTLSGIVDAATVVLAGSAIGMVKPKGRLIRANVQHGDAIVLFESSGIHANGLTLARAIAERAPNGYLTPLRDGRPYGEALLDPTHIYVGVVEDCLNRGVDIHYAVNVTGHGWRKLMRASEPFAYVVERVPDAASCLRLHPGDRRSRRCRGVRQFQHGRRIRDLCPRERRRDGAGRREGVSVRRAPCRPCGKQRHQARRHHAQGPRVFGRHARRQVKGVGIAQLCGAAGVR